MAEIDTLIDSEGQKENPAETRIKDLSNKVKLTAQERDELKTAKEQAEKDKALAEKKMGFYKDFSKQTAKYPKASEHQDEIEAKVMAGYDLEDATVSVLNKVGKLAPAPVERETIAGGSSATVTIADTANKSVAEMTQADRRKALEDIERESGGLTRILEKRSLA